MTLDEAVDKIGELGPDLGLTIHYGVEGWSGSAYWVNDKTGHDVIVDVRWTDDWWNETSYDLLEELYRRALVAKHGRSAQG